MAKAKVVHSSDACTIIFKGDKSNPEPSLGIIKFPGGHVEVSRCTDGTYWAHFYNDDDSSIIDSRIDYKFEAYKKHKGEIPSIPEHKEIQHMAVRVKGKYKDHE